MSHWIGDATFRCCSMLFWTRAESYNSDFKTTLDLSIGQSTHLHQPFINERLSHLVEQRRPIIDRNRLTSVLEHKGDRKVNKVPEQKNEQLPCTSQPLQNSTQRLPFVVNSFVAKLSLVVIQRDLLHGNAFVRIVKINVLRANTPAHRKLFHVSNRKGEIVGAFHVEAKRRNGELKVLLSELPPNLALD